MAQQPERDFPLGHPKAADTVMGSPQHLAWLRQFDTSMGERDFPVDHPAAVDTPGNKNSVVWEHGVDPRNAHLEAFTGLTPERAAAAREFSEMQSALAVESPALEPIDAEIANAALAAKRAELKVDFLTAEEHNEVLAAIQAKARDERDAAKLAEFKARKRAKDYLLFRGYAADKVDGLIETHGVVEILKAADKEQFRG
jgi:hypothetical protein